MARKPAAKKRASAAPKKKPAAKKKAAPRRPPAIKSPITKADLVTSIATNCNARVSDPAKELSKQQVQNVLGELESHIERSLRKGACGEFSFLGLMKMKVVKRPRKKRIARNPRTGDPITIRAQPNRKIVLIRAGKKLKEMIS